MGLANGPKDFFTVGSVIFFPDHPPPPPPPPPRRMQSKYFIIDNCHTLFPFCLRGENIYWDKSRVELTERETFFEFRIAKLQFFLFRYEKLKNRAVPCPTYKTKNKNKLIIRHRNLPSHRLRFSYHIFINNYYFFRSRICDLTPIFYRGKMKNGSHFAFRDPLIHPCKYTLAMKVDNDISCE